MQFRLIQHSGSGERLHGAVLHAAEFWTIAFVTAQVATGNKQHRGQYDQHKKRFSNGLHTRTFHSFMAEAECTIFPEHMPAETSNKTVLVAPLDWGLGHATRCIPVIRELLSMGCHVVIVTSGRPCCCCKKEFPEADFYDLPSYNIYYQKRGSFLVKLTIQLRKILGGIMREKRVTSQLIEQYDPVMIISDNRYGVRSKHVHTVFISHQMMIKIPG